MNKGLDSFSVIKRDYASVAHTGKLTLRELYSIREYLDQVPRAKILIRQFRGGVGSARTLFW